MAQDSKRKRRERKLRRERKQALRYCEATLDQLDIFKQIAVEYRMKELQDEAAKEQERESLIVKPTLGQVAQAGGLDFRGDKA